MRDPRSWLPTRAHTIAAAVQVHMPKLQPKRKAALEKLLGESMSVCLEMPFIEAAQADRRRSLRAMSQAWISYLTNVQVSSPAVPHL